MAIETIDVADALACAVDGEYLDDLDIFLSASASLTMDGVGLTVVVTEAPGEDATYRMFRFWGEEVPCPSRSASAT